MKEQSVNQIITCLKENNSKNNSRLVICFNMYTNLESTNDKAQKKIEDDLEIHQLSKISVSDFCWKDATVYTIDVSNGMSNEVFIELCKICIQYQDITFDFGSGHSNQDRILIFNGKEWGDLLSCALQNNKNTKVKLGFHRTCNSATQGEIIRDIILQNCKKNISELYIKSSTDIVIRTLHGNCNTNMKEEYIVGQTESDEYNSQLQQYKYTVSLQFAKYINNNSNKLKREYYVINEEGNFNKSDYQKHKENKQFQQPIQQGKSEKAKTPLVDGIYKILEQRKKKQQNQSQNQKI